VEITVKNRSGRLIRNAITTAVSTSAAIEATI
jgi:hypothetical protein